MTLEIIDSSDDNNKSISKLIANGFVLYVGSFARAVQYKECLEHFSSRMMLSCYEEHYLDKATGTPRSILRMTIQAGNQ
jgi:hypothetical protein